MWPGCKLVHGKPRHSQSQGSVERTNQDVESILACRLKENDTSHWAEGLRFVQFQKNTRHHRGIGRSPYKALFGENRYNGSRGAELPNEVWEQIETEEQLAEALNVTNVSTESSSNHRSAYPASAPSHDYEIDLTPTIVNINEPMEMTIQNVCNVCERQYEGPTKCKNCSEFCHAAEPCAVSKIVGDISIVVCQLCVKKIGMEKQRSGAHRNQLTQAENMLSSSAKRFKPANIGDNVAIPIPAVDKGQNSRMYWGGGGE